MSKKKQKTKRKGPSAEKYRPPAENRAAEAVTVGWMLSLFATVTAEFTGGVVRMVLLLTEGDSPALAVFSATLLGVATLSGVITLILTPVTISMRKVRPPQGIIYTAIVAGSVPLLILILMAIKQTS